MSLVYAVYAFVSFYLQASDIGKTHGLVPDYCTSGVEEMPPLRIELN
jgi:hypothetical protein